MADLDDFADLAEQYRPRGVCATGCGHPATDLWLSFRGTARYQFLCRCCTVKARLERAREYATRIAKLEAEYEAAKQRCEMLDLPGGHAEKKEGASKSTTRK